MDILETQVTNLNTNPINASESQTSDWNGLQVSLGQSDSKTQKTFEQSISIQNNGNITPKAMFAEQVGVILGGSGSIETNSQGETTIEAQGSIGDKSNDGNIKWGVSAGGQVSINNDGKVETEGKIEASVEGEF